MGIDKESLEPLTEGLKAKISCPYRSGGSRFHARGHVTTNSRSPTVTSLLDGMTRAPKAAERR